MVIDGKLTGVHIKLIRKAADSLDLFRNLYFGPLEKSDGYAENRARRRHYICVPDG